MPPGAVAEGLPNDGRVKDQPGICSFMLMETLDAIYSERPIKDRHVVLASKKQGHECRPGSTGRRSTRTNLGRRRVPDQTRIYLHGEIANCFPRVVAVSERLYLLALALKICEQITGEVKVDYFR